MKLRVTTADKDIKSYDVAEFKEGGVLMVKQTDGTETYLSPGFWQLAVLEGDSTYDVLDSVD